MTTLTQPSYIKPLTIILFHHSVTSNIFMFHHSVTSDISMFHHSVISDICPVDSASYHIQVSFHQGQHMHRNSKNLPLWN